MAEKTVLVVDDEEDILDSLRLLLETTSGVDVETANSGAEALKILARRKVDLIVSDYKMPEMSGIDLLTRVRETDKHTPLIMITAFPDPKLAQRAINELGVRHFIPKPLDLDFFLKAVDFALYGARSMKKPFSKD